MAGDGFSVAAGVIGELFWHIDEAVVIVDRGSVTAWNPSAERIFGVTASDALAPGFDLATVLGRAADQLPALLDGGTADLDCAGGCERVLEATSWHLGDEPGAPTVLVLRDVSGERRYRRGLERLNDVARELLSDAGSEVMFQRVATEAKAVTGADFSALVILREHSTTEISHFAYDAPRERFPEELPRIVGLLAVPIMTAAAARLDDIRGHPAGVGIPVQHPPIGPLLAVPILAGGEPIGELAVANEPGARTFDDTDEALLTELASHAAVALTLATARAARDTDAASRRDLMALALHNLRTPLAVIKGTLDVLTHRMDDVSPGQRAQLLESALRSVDRINGLAEERLDPRVAEADPSVTESVVPAELLDEVRAQLADTAAASRVEVIVELEPGLDAPVVLDATLVRHALENLLTNAIKHSPEAAQVSVTARREASGARFDVTDHGPGLSPAEQAMVFNGRYRTRGSIDGGVAGAGVGLSIVRRLLEASGGTIGVSSQSGHGATFWITVPIA
jgi:signal transduction histidine kinase